MKNICTILFTFVLVSGCYSIPEIEGFKKDQWSQDLENCQENKEAMGELLESNAELLYGEGEAEIKSLLGQPSEHELYRRNQKFFYYDLTSADCPNPKRLSIRFDALDRVKEVIVIDWIQNTES